jgi:carboxyl-terminal processing protease
LQRNDVLLRVDGEDARHWTVAQAVQRLRGPEGTRVRVTIARGGEEREILIERERFVR